MTTKKCNHEGHEEQKGSIEHREKQKAKGAGRKAKGRGELRIAKPGTRPKDGSPKDNLKARRQKASFDKLRTGKAGAN